MSDELMCQGRSGRRIRVTEARCADCSRSFRTFGLHDHDSETGEQKIQTIPCVVDIHCFRVAEPGECPTCNGAVLIASEPAP